MASQSEPWLHRRCQISPIMNQCLTSHTCLSLCKTQTPRISAPKAQIGLNIPLQVEISTVFEYITSSQYGTKHEKAARTALICSATSCHYNTFILNLLQSDITQPSRRVLNKHNGHFLSENKAVDYPLLRHPFRSFSQSNQLPHNSTYRIDDVKSWTLIG